MMLCDLLICNYKDEEYDEQMNNMNEHVNKYKYVL